MEDIDGRTEDDPTATSASMPPSTGPFTTGPDFSSSDVATAGAVDTTPPGGRVDTPGASADPVTGGLDPPPPKLEPVVRHRRWPRE